MSVTSTILLNKAIDPSQTVTLRNAFSQAMNRRFVRFRKNILEVIYEDDVFGLVSNRKPGPRAFAFPRSADKVAAFTEWLEEQSRSEILQVGQIKQVGLSEEKAWTNIFIQDAYKKGITKARTQLRKVAPSLSRTGGISISLATPSHQDRLGYLYTRAFNDLKGITDDMGVHIMRVVGQGLVNKETPLSIVEKVGQLIVGIGSSGITANAERRTPSQKRAELLARTEIIRAFAEAQLQEFANWGVHGVSAKAELSTANDERVCPRCAHLEKSIFTIEEARGMIPIHPLCRCIWLPYFE